jgi:hypothetical protein
LDVQKRTQCRRFAYWCLWILAFDPKASVGMVRKQ